MRWSSGSIEDEGEDYQGRQQGQQCFEGKEEQRFGTSRLAEAKKVVVVECLDLFGCALCSYQVSMGLGSHHCAFPNRRAARSSPSASILIGF